MVPTFVFHPAESHFPMNASEYAKECTLGPKGNYVWPHGSRPSPFNPDAPVYRHVSGSLTQYWLFYSYNDAYYFGNHVADIESVFVNSDAHMMHLSQHGNFETVEFGAVMPKVYIAKGSHACYPSAGNKSLYCCGLINDKCADGIEWQPHNIIDLDANPDDPFVTHKGDWGQEGVSALTVRPEWSRMV